MKFASRPRKGFTIVELLVAITLAILTVTITWALWKSMHSAMVTQRERGMQSGGAAIENTQLERLIGFGGGLLFASATELHFVGYKGEKRILKLWQDTLFLDERPILLHAQPHTISWTILGRAPPRLNSPTWNYRHPDRNDDGWLDWSELDADASSSLDYRELAQATLWILRFQDQEGFAYQGTAFVRNRAPSIFLD